MIKRGEGRKERKIKQGYLERGKERAYRAIWREGRKEHTGLSGERKGKIQQGYLKSRKFLILEVQLEIGGASLLCLLFIAAVCKRGLVSL